MHSRRYTAFISYRHADNTQEGRRWAEWLHRALERYTVPPDLIGTPNLRGEPVRDSLYPIFRDEDELPANADLATGIRAALEVSDHLIVLCSPRSAVSPWVRKEVREFKELGRSDRILAIIIAGEPNADDPAKAREGILRDEECFCEELRFGAVRDDGKLDWSIRTEPTAADLRPQGTRAEGFVTAEAYREHLTLNSSLTPDKVAARTDFYRQQLDHALLKVAAGLLVVPLGQLVDRDAAHRAQIAREELERSQAEATRLRLVSRRLMAAGVVVFVLAFLAALLGFFAARAKDRAVVQQKRAEDALIRGEKLIDYLVGDLHDNLRAVGRTEYLERAQDSVRAYYEAAGGQMGSLNAAKAFDQLGDLAMTRSNLATARQLYDRAAELLQEMGEEQVTFDILYEKTVNDKNLSWVASKMKDWEVAEARLADAFAKREILEKHAKFLSDRQRTDRVQVSLHDLQGDILRSQGNIIGAANSYTIAVRTASALLGQIESQLNTGDRDAFRVLRARSVALGKIGDIHLIATPSKTQEAAKAYSESLTDREKLTRLDPRNFEYQADLSVALNKVSQTEIQLQSWSDARKHIDLAIDIANKLSEFDPSNAIWRRNRILNLELRGDLENAAGNPDRAVQDYNEALQMESASPLSSSSQIFRQCWLQNKIGEALWAAMDSDRAAKAFDEGLKLLGQLRKTSATDISQIQALENRLQENIDALKIAR